MAENDAPERIWIREPHPQHPIGRLYKGHDIASQKVNNNDIEYVRADLAAPDAAQGNELEAAKAIVNKRARDDRDAYSADLTLVDDIARAIRDAVRQARRETWEAAITTAASVQTPHPLDTRTNNYRQKVIEVMEAAALRAEGEKGEGNARSN